MALEGESLLQLSPSRPPFQSSSHCSPSLLVAFCSSTSCSVLYTLMPHRRRRSLAEMPHGTHRLAFLPAAQRAVVITGINTDLPPNGSLSSPLVRPLYSRERANFLPRLLSRVPLSPSVPYRPVSPRYGTAMAVSIFSSVECRRCQLLPGPVVDALSLLFSGGRALSRTRLTDAGLVTHSQTPNRAPLLVLFVVLDRRGLVDSIETLRRQTNPSEGATI
jgi:hypothetical protein